MIFRTATIEDIREISELRKKQIQDEGQKPTIDIDEDLYRYFEKYMRSGELIEWIAEDEGKIIATTAIVFMDFPPSFTNKTGRTGYVANVYTADEYRGRGIAGQLLDKVEEEAKKRGITKLLLHASELGRKAYIKSGYEDVDIEMEKIISE
ncbi:MAG: GNAT family N-acetyltransferase [Anaerolineaceae bacterium]|nr:GNAT family N-acetyltransferase [Anaerolineaceae bacterium]